MEIPQIKHKPPTPDRLLLPYPETTKNTSHLPYPEAYTIYYLNLGCGLQRAQRQRRGQQQPTAARTSSEHGQALRTTDC